MDGFPHIFQWDGGGNEVFLVCSFNSCEKIRVNNSNGLGGVCIDLMLPVGTHNYMFIVDGEWKLDPSNTLPITSGQNQVSIIDGLQLDNSDSSDGVDSDTESMASQASSSGSGPKGQRRKKLYMTFPEAAKDQLHGYLMSSSYKDNINVHYLNGHSAIVKVTPPSVAESVIAVMNGAMISRLKVKAYERKSRPSETKPEAKVGGAVIATGGSGSDSETFKVYVGSKLPEYTNEQHIREHFKRFASSIVRVELVKNWKTKTFQGFAFVHFSTAKSAQASIRALNHSNLLGVRVKVSPANNPKKEEVDADLISHSFGPAGQGEIFSLPQENPLPIFSHHANAQGEDDQDLSDNESISSNMSAYTDKVKVIVHSTPKFPDRLSNRAFKKHFKEIESAVCRAFIARNHKTRKSLGFGIIFFSSMDLAQFAKGKYVNTVIDEKYKIISMGIEGSGDSRPPKGDTSPHLTGVGQNHSQSSAPHPKGLQLDNSDSSDGVDTDTESMASQASSSGSGPKGQRGKKLYMTFPEAAKDQLHGYLMSSSYKDNINVHYLNGHSAIVKVTPPSVAESVIAVMNGAMISRLKVKAYERKSRPSKTKPEAKVGGAVIATGGSGSDSETFKVYVGSKLPEYTNEQHIREHFKRFASSIVKVELVKNRKTKTFQGFAFVHFSTAKSAQASIRALNHSNLLGVRVKVSPANNPKKEEVDADLISHSFGPAGQGEIFSLPQENPLPIFSHHANAQGEDDQDLSDNESISSNMSAYTDKVKVIVHSTPKFPDRLSNRAFKKHFKEIESAVCRAFIARNHKTRKSLGFGIIFFSSMDLAQFAKGKYVNTVIDEKYKIISMGIEGSGDSRPPKGDTSPHLTGVGQNHSQSSAPHPKGLQLDNSDSSDGVDTDTESMASQASSSGSGPKGQRGKKLYMTFPEAAKDQLHGYLMSSSYKDNINVHYLNGHSAIVKVTPPSVAESVIAVMNGAMISRLKVKAYERKSRPSKTKPEANVGGAVIATGGSGSDSETFKVYVGSKLPEYTNEQHIREHFKRFASSIVKVELVKNRKTKTFQGFAFVHFSTAKSAQASIRALNHSNLLGVRVKVSPANNPKKEEVDADLISHSFGPAGQGEIFSLPQENPLPIFSHHANAQGEDDQDLSDNESISSNMSAYTDKVKVIVHSTPKFPDRLSNRAFKKHFKEIESAVCRAFIARNHKTRKSLGFGIIFFSSMDLAQFAKGKYVNTVIDEKYKIISMGIEGSGDSRPPKGDTSPHLTGVGQNHSQSSAPHPKGNRKNSDPHPTRGDVRGSGHHPRNLVPYQQSHGNPQPHPPNLQPLAPEDCVVVENIDSSIGESEVSSLLAPIKMLSFNRSPNGVVTIKLYSYNDSRAAVLKLNGMTFLGYISHAYIPIPPPGGPNPSALHGPHGNYHPSLQPAVTNQFPPTQANIPRAVQGRPATEITQPRFEHSQFYLPHPMQGVNRHVRSHMHVRPPMPGNMPPYMGGNSVPNYGHSQSFPHGAAIQDPSVQNNPFLSPKKTQPGIAVKVTHLPPTVTEDKLYLHFRQVGEINGQPVIHATAKSIYAHVNFFHPHVAENAARLDQSVLDGTVIRVKLQCSGRGWHNEGEGTR